MTLQEQLNLFNPHLPLDQAHTPPARWYTDPLFLQAEEDQIFRKTWQLVGSTDSLKEPGDYFTLEIAGEPILVTLASNRQIVALSNVCRHHAATLMPESCGHAKRFQCLYHGWTYDLAGNLIGTPEWRGVSDFSKEKTRLPNFEIKAHPPFLFLCLEPESADLSSALPPFLKYHDIEILSQFHFFERKEYQLDCNWKVFVDNYLDGGYHVNTLHRSLASVLDYSQYQTHLFPGAVLQSSPTDASINNATSAVRRGHAYYWWLFPNTMINLYQDTMDVNIVLPLGADRCRVLFDYYFTDRAKTGDKFISQSIETAHQIQLEDEAICARVQKGLKSRYFKTGRYSVTREAGAHYFHKLLFELLSNKSH